MSDPNNPTRPAADHAFDPDFLADLDQQDDPPTSGDLAHSGPLRIEELADGRFALYRPWSDQEEGAEPCAVFAAQEESLAVMTAGILPLMAGGRGYWMRASQTSEPGRELCRHGRAVGRLRHLDEEALAILNFCEALVRSPESIAAILESAGAPVLRVAGKILALRLAARMARMLEKREALQLAAQKARQGASRK